MQVTNNTQTAAQTAAAPQAAANNGAASTLDYNAFLRLLMAQMQNQDPTNPTDSTQWVSQLATFSSVEQSIQMNAKLDNILLNSGISEAGALIGRSVATADGQTFGTVAGVRVSSSGTSATLTDGSVVDISSGVTVM